MSTLLAKLFLPRDQENKVSSGHGSTALAAVLPGGRGAGTRRGLTPAGHLPGAWALGQGYVLSPRFPNFFLPLGPGEGPWDGEQGSRALQQPAEGPGGPSLRPRFPWIPEKLEDP